MMDAMTTVTAMITPAEFGHYYLTALHCFNCPCHLYFTKLETEA